MGVYVERYTWELKPQKLRYAEEVEKEGNGILEVNFISF